jgi:hypothetical protein
LLVLVQVNTSGLSFGVLAPEQFIADSPLVSAVEELRGGLIRGSKAVQ